MVAWHSQIFLHHFMFFFKNLVKNSRNSHRLVASHTVDGRNPLFSHYLQGFIHPRWLAGFLPPTVWNSISMVEFWQLHPVISFLCRLRSLPQVPPISAQVWSQRWRPKGCLWVCIPRKVLKPLVQEISNRTQ